MISAKSTPDRARLKCCTPTQNQIKINVFFAKIIKYSRQFMCTWESQHKRNCHGSKVRALTGTYQLTQTAHASFKAIDVKKPLSLKHSVRVT